MRSRLSICDRRARSYPAASPAAPAFRVQPELRFQFFLAFLVLFVEAQIVLVIAVLQIFEVVTNQCATTIATGLNA